MSAVENLNLVLFDAAHVKDWAKALAEYESEP